MLIFSILILIIFIIIGGLGASNKSSNRQGKEKCPKCGSNDYEVTNGYNIEHKCNNCGYDHTIWG